MGNIENYRAVHDAYNRRDWAALVQRFAPDASYTDQARSVTMKTPNELVDYLRVSWVDRFSDIAITEAEYIVAGDAITCEFICTGTNDGPFAPMPATGRRLASRFCEVMRFDAEGSIVNGSLYYDRLSILVQLGHAEAAPEGRSR